MSRLLRLFVVFALVLLPLGLVSGGHAAQAAPMTLAGHCAGTRDQAPSPPAHHSPGQAADCAIACSALPARADVIAPPESAMALLHAPRPAALSAVMPEAATPPPRLS